MEPLDLCVRPHLCKKCKRRFWTLAELKKHMKASHKTRSSVISHTGMFGNPPSVSFKQGINSLPQNSSALLHPRSTQMPNYTTSIPTSIFQSQLYSAVPYNQGLNRFSHISRYPFHPGLVQVPYDITSISKNISQTRIVGTNKIPNSPSARLNSQIPCGSKNFGSIQITENTAPVSVNFLKNASSPSTSFSLGRNELPLNSSVSLNPELVQVPGKKPVNISHLKIVETNQNPNFPSSHFNRKLIQMSQNPSRSMHLGSVQMPDKSTPFSTSILNSFINGKFQNPYSPSEENKELYKQSQNNSSVSVHPVLVQEPDNIASSQTNTSPTLTAEIKQSSNSPCLLNQGPNEQPQNSSDELHPGSVQIQESKRSIPSGILHSLIVGENQGPNQLAQASSDSLISRSVQIQDNRLLNPNSILHSLVAEESQNLFSSSALLDQEPYKLSENSNITLHPTLVQEPDNTTSIPDNISCKQSVETNPTSYSPSIPCNQPSMQLSQNSSASLILTQSGLVQVQENSELIQANNSHSWIVGVSSQSPSALYKQVPFEQLEKSRVLVQPDTTKSHKKEIFPKKENLNIKTIRF